MSGDRLFSLDSTNGVHLYTLFTLRTETIIAIGSFQLRQAARANAMRATGVWFVRVKI